MGDLTPPEITKKMQPNRSRLLQSAKISRNHSLHDEVNGEQYTFEAAQTDQRPQEPAFQNPRTIVTAQKMQQQASQVTRILQNLQDKNEQRQDSRNLTYAYMTQNVPRTVGHDSKAKQRQKKSPNLRANFQTRSPVSKGKVSDFLMRLFHATNDLKDVNAKLESKTFEEAQSSIKNYSSGARKLISQTPSKAFLTVGNTANASLYSSIDNDGSKSPVSRFTPKRNGETGGTIVRTTSRAQSVQKGQIIMSDQHVKRPKSSAQPVNPKRQQSFKNQPPMVVQGWNNSDQNSDLLSYGALQSEKRITESFKHDPTKVVMTIDEARRVQQKMHGARNNSSLGTYMNQV